MVPSIVPLRADPASLVRDLERLWADGDVALLVADTDAPPPFAEADLRTDAAALPDDAALVVLTSGSTGRPRGVVLSHAALSASVRLTNARLGCRPGDRWTLALPPHHVAGLMVLLRAHALGTEPVGLDASEGTHVALVPTQLGRLLDAGTDPSRFATVLIGGGPDPGRHVERARALGARVVVSYGMTETCGGCVHDGVPLPGVEVDVLPDGRIRVRGPVLASGYLDAGGPAAGGSTGSTASATGATDGAGFRPDGWFVTGDVGRLADGRLVVEGRSDDVLLSGGENVPASAVALRLLDHPAVDDAVVLGVVDPDWGQRVRAIVAPAAAAAPPSLAALRAHVRVMLPASHAPTELLVVDRIPRDALGKLTDVARRELVARAATEQHAASAGDAGDAGFRAPRTSADRR